MNSTLLAFLGLIAAVALAGWLFMRKKSTPAQGEEKQKVAGISKDMEEMYDVGMNPGSDGVPVLYALVTCRHCKKTREFLDELQAKYHLIYVDNFTSDARKLMMEKVRSYNPRGSFPTMVTSEGTVVVGFREQQIKEALHL